MKTSAALVVLLLAAPLRAGTQPDPATYRRALSEAERAREPLERCLSDIEAWIAGAAAKDARRCLKEAPPLPQGLAENRRELQQLTCSRRERDLRGYFRCLQIAGKGEAGDYCRWLEARSEGPGVYKNCLAHDRLACATGDLAFAVFVRLGQAMIEKNAARVEKLCVEAFSKRSAAACRRLAAGDVKGTCADPAFFLNVAQPDKPGFCETSLVVLEGRHSCDVFPNFGEATQTMVNELQDLCRELVLYREARPSRDPRLCGDSSAAPVCRLLLTGDAAECAHHAERARAASCSVVVDRLADDSGAPRYFLLRENSDGLPADLWGRCRERFDALSLPLERAFEASPVVGEGEPALLLDELHARRERARNILESTRPR